MARRSPPSTANRSSWRRPSSGRRSKSRDSGRSSCQLAFPEAESPTMRTREVMITRRRLVIVLGLGGVAFARSSFAQQRPQGIARIGVLPLGSPTNSYDLSLVEAFRQGLREV